MSDAETLVSTLRAAGETTRLRLLALLADGEHPVKDLTDILGQSQPRVSRHLKLLADAGLVDRHAEGAWAYYRLAEDGEGGALARWLIGRLEATDGEIARDRDKLVALRAAQQARAADYFAKVAERWDQIRALHVPEAAVEAAILSLFAGRRVPFLIDLGTGTGRMLELLAPHYASAMGVDSSREMIAVARAKLAAAGIGHAQVRLGDIGALEPGQRQADAIVLHQVLHYFDDPGRLLALARQVLRPGGEIVVVDFAPHEHEFLRAEQAHRRLGLSDAQMAGWARAAGLAVETARQFPNPEGAGGLTVCLWRLLDDSVSRSET